MGILMLSENTYVKAKNQLHSYVMETGLHNRFVKLTSQKDSFIQCQTVPLASDRLTWTLPSVFFLQMQSPQHGAWIKLESMWGLEIK